MPGRWCPSDSHRREAGPPLGRSNDGPTTEYRVNVEALCNWAYTDVIKMSAFVKRERHNVSLCVTLLMA